MDIRKRRRITASSMFKKNRKETVFVMFFLSIIFVGIVLFINFMKDFSTGATKNHMKSLIEEKNEKAGFTKEFFERNFTKKTIDVFGIRKGLSITANDLGEKFWREEFTQMVQESENKALELVSIAEQINREAECKGDCETSLKKKVDLSDYPIIYDLIKDGVNLSLKTKFNIADGDISFLWKKAFVRYGEISKARKNIEIFEQQLLLNAQERTLSNEAVSKIKEKLENNKNFVETTSILPDMKNIKAFIPFANPDFITFNEKEKTVQITSSNTSIDLSAFKEAIFLKILSKKLPERMNYFVILGDRHGMWKLDKNYERWSVSIDDPYSLIDVWRGAIALRAESGFFAIAHKKEDYVMVPLDKKPTEIELKESFKKNYVFDITQNKYFKIYDLPIDWKTAMPAEENLAAMVLDSEPVKARMKSLALFLSNENETEIFRQNFKETKFLILHKDQTIYVPESAKEDFIPKKKLTKKK